LFPIYKPNSVLDFACRRQLQIEHPDFTSG